MKAYVDLQKVLPRSLYTLIIDLRHNPTSTAKERSVRLNRSVQIISDQFQRLKFMGLAMQVGHGKYINILDSKINDFNE